MGGLHEGHGQLIRRAAQQGPVLVSVFVNPLQFGPTEDFDRYPRTLEADRVLAQGSGANALWAPTVDTSTPVDLIQLCPGQRRPPSSPISAAHPVQVTLTVWSQSWPVSCSW